MTLLLGGGQTVDEWSFVIDDGGSYSGSLLRHWRLVFLLAFTEHVPTLPSPDSSCNHLCLRARLGDHVWFGVGLG